MATYYVRKTGNNGSAGTSAGAAWLTVNYALSVASSGDTVYVGGGIYRETVQITSTTAASAVNVIGDVDGSLTGDLGEVQITAYTSNDKTAPSGTSLLDLNSKPYHIFKKLVFVGGNAHLLINTGGGLCEETQFIDCAFLHMATGNYRAISLVTTTTDLAPNWLFDRCRFLFQGGTADCIFLDVPEGVSVDLDTNIIIRHCFIINTSSGASIMFNPTVGTNESGGVKIYNNTLLGGNTGFRYNTNSSTTYPCLVYNNVICTYDYGIYAVNASTITEDYNHIFSATTLNNVTGGGSSKTNDYAALYHVGQELQQGKLLRPFFMPTANSPALGFGNNGTYTSAYDILNRIRPSGGGVFSSANKAVGCYERHDLAVKEVSVSDVGTSIKWTGPGDHRILVPVNDAVTTISIKVRRDGNYGVGTMPTLRLEANGEIGVATQSVADVGSNGVFNTISLSSFTPTAKGWVVITLESYAAGNGIVYWDTLSVS